MSSTHVIRTPDQRLRIFVSSTLQELAPERQATRTAIERLHLAPVMFELGARPHPPRELYRAYLEQSDVFLGLYWERYGWTAPDEEVSGLEDEYNLCPAQLPRLLYIKSPAENREPGLTKLLNRIRDDDRAAYKYFETAKELARLVEADLATLLAERFEQSQALLTVGVPGEADRVIEPARLPVPLTDLIGRAADVDGIGQMFESGARLVTLTGPGGIGKSRLAIAAAEAATPGFADGAVFVDLTAVHDGDRVPNTIAQALGVRDTGDAPVMDNLVTALNQRRILLVLDNFEQVLPAAPVLTALLAAAPGVSMLVTSRVLLRVNGEHSFEVGPLAEDSSVNLFVERAHAVKPDFELTSENAGIVARVCSAVDGMPLAIELAAARIRVLSPADLLERLDRRLSVLVGGSRDMPERQQTLRRTIEWSTQLLDEDQRQLLTRLGVFEGGFTLDAAEFVGLDGDPDAAAGGGDVLTDLSALVDSSLVHQHEGDGRPRFSMQAIVREYARERLWDAGDLQRVRDAHARYFLALGDRVETQLKGGKQRESMQRLGEERDNLRAAERYLLGTRDWDRAAHLAFSLYLYWWVSGLLGEVRTWMDEALDSGEQLPDHTWAIAIYFTRTIMFWKDPDGSVAADLTEAAELFNSTNDPEGEALTRISLALSLLAGGKRDTERAEEVMQTSMRLFRENGSVWGESMALVILGRVALLQKKLHKALKRFEKSLALTKSAGDAVGERIASYHLGWAQLLLGEVEDARRDFALSVTVSTSIGHVEGLAYGLEGMVAVAALAGNADRAGRLAGAARALRERSGLHNGPMFTFHQAFLDQLVAAGKGEQLDAAIAAGRQLTVEQAVAEALAAAQPAQADQPAQPAQGSTL
ncbi:ATP-binding protein [Leifsonia sp. NPDC058248]|uniref:ATP-binding protein n=1 Tax=Leifsonia sp. NPDC058248 TaxID=3346402 RepID=UPI0036DCF317